MNMYVGVFKYSKQSKNAYINNNHNKLIKYLEIFICFLFYQIFYFIKLIEY
jgi:hypothetical protein